MSVLAVTYTFQPDTTIFSNEVNQNFSDISLWANGNITNSNLGTLTGVVNWTLGGADRAISISSTSTNGAIQITSSGSASPFIINDSGASGAIPAFQVLSTTRGTIPAPVMTTTQREAISTPIEGLSVFDSTLGKLHFYTGSAWNSPIDETSVATLTNKTLVEPIIEEPSITEALIEGIKLPSAAKTASYSVVSTDNIIRANANSGPITITLLPATDAPYLTEVIKIDSTLNVVTVSDPVSGFSTTLNTQGEALRLLADGTTYLVLERRIPQVRNTYTPIATLTNNIGSVTGSWIRNGRYADVNIVLLFSGANTQSFTTEFSMPAGMLIDTTVAGTIGNASFFHGISGWYEAGNTHFAGVPTVGSLGVGGVDYVRPTITIGATSPAFVGLRAVNPSTSRPAAATNGSGIFLIARVPITGWNG